MCICYAPTGVFFLLLFVLVTVYTACAPQTSKNLHLFGDPLFLVVCHHAMSFIIVEFRGGLEDLMEKRTREVCIDIPEHERTIKGVITYVIEHLIIKNKESFYNSKDEQLNPGILVLHNNCDWELLQKDQSIVTSGDRITFISAIHGG